MAGMVLIGVVMLLGIGGAVAIALLSGASEQTPEHTQAFAVLPVPEDTPSARAFLEHYTSQVAWMDTSVLRCVILVSNPDSQTLCEELAREYACYQTMTLPQMQGFLASQCRKAPNSGKTG